MARSRTRWHPPWLYLLVVSIALIVQHVAAKKEPIVDVARMSVLEIEDALQQCPLIRDLNRHRAASNPQTSGLTSQVFAFLFPGSPAINALLATLYISGPPNFLLALCPPNIDPSSLSVMVAFAVGGLLGDTIFHLLPEIFLGEASPEEARFVLVEPNKNLLLGVAILLGFVTFVAMDKGLRIATGGEGGHEHSHGKKSEVLEPEKDAATSAKTSGATSDLSTNTLKSRKPGSSSATTKIPPPPSKILQEILAHEEPLRSERWLRAVVEEDASSDITQIVLWQAYQSHLKTGLLPASNFIKNIIGIFPSAEAQTIGTPEGKGGSGTKYIIKGIRPRFYSSTPSVPSSPPISTPGNPSPSIRLSAYLNLIADFTHNITDGLALASSFHASPTLGATTAVAVFFHEIPHEVGDFALLIQSGFSKRRAMGAQFVTALGAFLGTGLGIAVQSFGGGGGGGDGDGEMRAWKGLAGTGLGWGDLLLPFTAGTFLYVGTVAVIPELLETGPDRRHEVRKTAKQFVAMALGAGIMLGISWS